jgi:hypothetical protein
MNLYISDPSFRYYTYLRQCRKNNQDIHTSTPFTRQDFQCSYKIRTCNVHNLDSREINGLFAIEKPAQIHSFHTVTALSLCAAMMCQPGSIRSGYTSVYRCGIQRRILHIEFRWTSLGMMITTLAITQSERTRLSATSLWLVSIITPRIEANSNGDV